MKPWVSLPISGLYESIPANTSLKFGPFEIETLPDSGDGYYSTRFFRLESKPDEKTLLAVVGRKFSPDRTKVELAHSILKTVSGHSERAPKFLSPPGVIEMVAGRGIPTNLFLSLLQMRIAGVKYGSLKSLDSGITNVQAALEVLQQAPVWSWLQAHSHATTIPAGLVAAALPSTQSGRYIEALMTQSGHKIIQWKVQSPVFIATLASIKQRTDVLAADLGSLLFEKFPGGRNRALKPSTRLPTVFQVKLELGPI